MALLDEIKENVGDYCIEHGNPMSNKTLDQFAQEVFRTMEQRYAVFKYLWYKVFQEKQQQYSDKPCYDYGEYI